MKRLYTYSKPDAQLLAQRKAEEKHTREFPAWWWQYCSDDLLKDPRGAHIGVRRGIVESFSAEKYL